VGSEDVYAQIDVEYIQALVGANLATHFDPADNIVSEHLGHLHLDDPVVQRDLVARFHNAGQGLKAHGHALVVSDDGLGGEDEFIACPENIAFAVQLAYPHFGAGKVCHDGKPSALFMSGFAELEDVGGVIGEIPMRIIEAGNIHPGRDHLAHHLR